MITVLLLLPRYRGNHDLLNLQAGLDPARFRVVVAYLSGAADGEDGLARVAARVVHLGARPGWARWFNVPLVRRLRRLIDEEGVQVLACHQHRTVPLGVLAARGARARPAVVAVLHGLRSARGTGRRLANAWLHPRLTRIVAVSETVAADVRRAHPGLAPEQVVTVHNGIDLARFAPAADVAALRRELLSGREDACWFGTAGRLVAGKNHATLLEAFAGLAGRLADAQLLIAGQGPLEADLRAQAQRLGVAERVTFLGYRRDLPRVLAALDVFVLPSLREGFGLTLLEAMASGCVVVAGQVGAAAEVVGDGAFARLVDPRDAAAMGAAMLAFAEVPAPERRRLGEAARARAAGHFDAPRMVAGYERVFAEAYAAHQARR